MTTIAEEREHIKNIVGMAELDYVSYVKQQNHKDLVHEAMLLRRALQSERTALENAVSDFVDERQRAKNAEAALQRANAEIACYQMEMTRDALNLIPVSQAQRDKHHHDLFPYRT